MKAVNQNLNKFIEEKRILSGRILLYFFNTSYDLQNVSIRVIKWTLFIKKINDYSSEIET